MKITLAQTVQVLDHLAETPSRITSAVSGLENSLLHCNPDPDSWSVNDVLTHLNACAEVWGTQIKQMLEKKDQTLRHISPRIWIKRTEYPSLAFEEGFVVFTRRREKLMAVLQGLDFAQWSNSAFIKNRTHTVYSHARRMALHEQDHMEQIEKLITSLHD